MTTNPIQLLRDHWDEVPEADEQTVRKAYTYATGPRASYSFHALSTLRPRPRVLVPALAAAVCATAGAILLSNTVGSATTSTLGSSRNSIGSHNPTGSKTHANGPQTRNGAPRQKGFGGVPVEPPSRPISVSDASTTFGAPIVLPDSALAKPSDAGSAVGDCPYTASGTDACWIYVSFPAQSLTVSYSRPVLPNTPGRYHNSASQYPSIMTVVDLNGTPALVIKQFNSASFPDASNPGSVEFVVGGTRVIVSGYYDDATLESVAQSIINQATASP